MHESSEKRKQKDTERATGRAERSELGLSERTKEPERGGGDGTGIGLAQAGQGRGEEERQAEGEGVREGGRLAVEKASQSRTTSEDAPAPLLSSWAE